MFGESVTGGARRKCKLPKRDAATVVNIVAVTPFVCASFFSPSALSVVSKCTILPGHSP